MLKDFSLEKQPSFHWLPVTMWEMRTVAVAAEFCSPLTSSIAGGCTWIVFFFLSSSIEWWRCVKTDVKDVVCLLHFKATWGDADKIYRLLLLVWVSSFSFNVIQLPYAYFIEFLKREEESEGWRRLKVFTRDITSFNWRFRIDGEQRLTTAFFFGIVFSRKPFFPPFPSSIV